jgi:hypothetical protein
MSIRVHTLWNVDDPALVSVDSAHDADVAAAY